MGGENLTKTVSIVIPCRNEEKFIGKCIESFMIQSYPRDLITVVIADGMSTDNTRKVIEEYESKYGNVILVDNPQFTAPKGMNIGIKATNSDIVIIFGAHSFADKDFILENVKALDNASYTFLPTVRLNTIDDSALPKDAQSAATLPPPGAGEFDASSSTNSLTVFVSNINLPPITTYLFISLSTTILPFFITLSTELIPK